MRVEAFGATALGLAMAMSGGSALAQPQLQGVEPARNSTVAAPNHVALHFTEALTSKGTFVRVDRLTAPEVSGPKFSNDVPQPRTTATGVDAADPQSLRAVFAKPLEPGLYTVQWRAGGADGKLTRGRYSFVVK